MPVGLFHLSFRDFLLDPETRLDHFPEYIRNGEINRAAWLESSSGELRSDSRAVDEIRVDQASGMPTTAFEGSRVPASTSTTSPTRGRSTPAPTASSTLIEPTIPSPEVLLLPNDRSRFEQHEPILCTRIILIAPSRIFDPHLRPATARSGNTWKPRVFGALPARYIANVSFKASKRQSHKSFMQCYDCQLRIRWK